MALPTIVLPAALLPWLKTPHESQDEDVYGYVTHQAGASRTRSLYTSAGRYMTVAMEVDEARRQVFHDWYENTLQSGSLPFSIQVQDFGPDLVWFKAYMPTYSFEPRAPGALTHTFKAQVYLTGDPSIDGPDTGEFTATIRVDVLADLTVDRPIPFLSATINIDVIATVGIILPGSPYFSSYRTAYIGEIPFEAFLFTEGLLPPGVILRQSRRDYDPPPDDTDILLRQRVMDYFAPEVGGPV